MISKIRGEAWVLEVRQHAPMILKLLPRTYLVRGWSMEAESLFDMLARGIYYAR
jgi:hypothetical protein